MEKRQKKKVRKQNKMNIRDYSQNAWVREKEKMSGARYALEVDSK